MADPLPVNEHQALRFDWEAVDDRPITAVLGCEERTSSDGSLSWAKIGLVLDTSLIVLSVTADSDEVVIDLVDDIAASESGEWTPVSGLRGMIGCRLGWCWVACNSQGYLDSFSLALDGIEPTHTFVAISATLECLTFEKIRAA